MQDPEAWKIGQDNESRVDKGLRRVSYVYFNLDGTKGEMEDAERLFDWITGEVSTRRLYLLSAGLVRLMK